MENKFIPYTGWGNIKLYDKLENIRSILSEENIKYSMEEIDNSDCIGQNNWYVIIIDEIKLYFASKNLKLFGIYSTRVNSPRLINGICPGMKISDAMSIDPSLKYNIMDEVYESKHGFIIEENPFEQTVDSIYIFIKEIYYSDFDDCNW